MTLLHKSEHLACLNYDNSAKPAAETLKLIHGQTIDMTISQTVIVFMMNGNIRLLYENSYGWEMEQGQIMLFAAGTKMCVTPLKDTNVFVIRIKKRVQLCDKLSLEKLFIQTGKTDHAPIPINRTIKQYVELFEQCVADGLRCAHFLDIKIAELFFLLRGYYTKDQLAAFFYPLLSPDAKFTDFVWQNYQRARNVKDLAQMSAYGISTFKAKFRKTFGVSALHWMNEQKMRNLYHELNYSDKSLKQISTQLHFASVTHLTTFCKQKLGATPGQIRRTGKEQKLL